MPIAKDSSMFCKTGSRPLADNDAMQTNRKVPRHEDRLYKTRIALRDPCIRSAVAWTRRPTASHRRELFSETASPRSSLIPHNVSRNDGDGRAIRPPSPNRIPHRVPTCLHAGRRFDIAVFGPSPEGI
jgi:hypothetical protein